MVDDQGGAPKQEGDDDASQHRASLRGFKSAAGLMHSAAARQRASAGKQHWFCDDPELAQRRVRKILAGARSTLVVLDPYFRAADIRPYLPWVTGRDVQIQVLTSTKGLRDIPHSLALGGAPAGRVGRRAPQRPPPMCATYP